MTTVFMFPGQSSRYPGMLDKLCDLHPANRELLGWASDLLGRDLRKHYAAEAAVDPFARNVDVQVGVFLANHMYLRALEAHDIRAELSLGLSLGEWNHLVHIGALAFDQALRAVEQRGRLYDEGPRGWMAAIQPIDEDDLAALVEQAQEHGRLEIVNFNSPRQFVIAGEQAAVEFAAEQAEHEHFAQAHVIERQVPMHSSLFAPVAERFAEFLTTLEFSPPERPWLANRLGDFVEAPTQARFVELLASHVCQPVLWRQSIDAVVAREPDAVFVEVGPMAVLHNLLHRKWHGNRKFRTDDRDATSEHFAGLVAGLRTIG
ncbi:ACP S-malonyltransferase [Nannocystaceae bacterium ST9]